MRRLLPDLFHVALAREWQQAQPRGMYTRSTTGLDLADVGFLHASFAWQVAGVLSRYYADTPEDLVLLRVDPGPLDVPVRVEPPPGSTEGFPHVYGPLPVHAVVEQVPLARVAGGGWALPDWLTSLAG